MTSDNTSLARLQFDSPASDIAALLQPHPLFAETDLAALTKLLSCGQMLNEQHHIAAHQRDDKRQCQFGDLARRTMALMWWSSGPLRGSPSSRLSEARRHGRSRHASLLLLGAPLAPCSFECVGRRRRGRHRDRLCVVASEPVSEFDRRPFEHPLLSSMDASCLSR